jgi:SAM-dependent methyltransferase
VKGYHRFVFDSEQRRFVGAFEEMYQAEEREGFDSWHQDDVRQLSKQVTLAILADYNFARVLDVGCGKGAFTRWLQRANNDVVALDLSETALRVARARHPGIDFRQADLRDSAFSLASLGQFDLVCCLETLSYLDEWRDVLAAFARMANYALVALYLPPDPIGMVKSFDHLRDAFAGSFTMLQEVHLEPQRQLILFGRRLGRPPE